MRLQFNPMVVAAGVSLVIGAFSAVNQVTGTFAQISIWTAVASVFVGLSVAVGGPRFLAKRAGTDRLTKRISVKSFSIALGAAVIIAGIGPFAGKYLIASAAENGGTGHFKRQLYVASLSDLEKAAGYFEDLGFGGRTKDIQVRLAQAYEGAGYRERAYALIEEMESSGALDDDTRARLLVVRGNLEYELGRFELAEQWYNSAHQVVTKGNRAHAVLLANEAAFWLDRGGFYAPRAAANLDEARQIYEDLDDQLGIAYVTATAGDAESLPAEQRSLYQRALSIALEQGDVVLAATMYRNIGITFRLEGDLDTARDNYAQSIAEFERAVDPVGKAAVLTSMARLEQAGGRYTAATEFLNQAAAALSNINPGIENAYPRKLGDVYTALADSYDILGEQSTAEEGYEAALKIFDQHPYPRSEVATLLNYAGLLLRLDRREEGSRLLNRARSLLESFGTDSSTGSWGVLENNMGYLDQVRGAFDEAQAHYRRALEHFESIEDKLGVAQASENIAIVEAFSGGDPLPTFEIVLEIYRDLKNISQQVQTLFNIYSVLSSRFDPAAPERAAELLTLLENQEIDVEVQSRILTGLAVVDIPDARDLRVLREKLIDLKRVVESSDDKVELGRLLLQLARVDLQLDNGRQAVDWSGQAAEYVDEIPMPERVAFLSGLAQPHLFGDDGSPSRGMEYMWDSFDLVVDFELDTQAQQADLIVRSLLIVEERLDPEDQRVALIRAADRATDAEARDKFQAALVVAFPPAGPGQPAPIPESGGLSVGDCIHLPPDGGTFLVFCATIHQYEVVYVAEFPEGPYLGDQAVSDAVANSCRGEFPNYVGISFADSMFGFVSLTPTETGWVGGDREFVCMLANLDESPLFESQRGSEQ